MSDGNHHYVPRFILRHFLSDARKEQVTVFDKRTDRVFPTAIGNIMAEHDFHAFAFDDFLISFESIATQIENISIPAYEEVIASRRLDGSPEQKAALAFLIAFQFLRTKGHRDMYQDLEDLMRKAVEESGGKLEDLQNYTPLTPDDAKLMHVKSFQKDTGQFAQIIAQKDFVLQAAAPGRSFYLGDHPVVLNNMRDHGPYGNIGLGVEGIEIYMPLASDLLLSAYCPSIAVQARANLNAVKDDTEAQALRELMAGQISAAEMKARIERAKPYAAPTEEFLNAMQQGTPVSATGDNMDFFNGLQMRHATRFVVSRDGDFGLAREINKRYPGEKGGLRFTA